MSFFWIISLLFTAVFSVTGPFIQFFPLFLKDNNLDTSQIAWAMGLLSLSKIFSTALVAFFIDRSKKPHFYLAFAAGFTAIIWSCIVLFNVSGIYLIPITFLFAFTWSASVPLSEGFSVRACRLAPNLDYGKMRLFGSAAFILSGLLCGALMDQFGREIFALYLITSCLVLMVIALNMPNFYEIERRNNVALPTTNIDVIKQLIFNKNFLYIVFGAGIMHAGHALLFQSAAIEWISSGYSGDKVALFFAIGVIAEIILFYFASNLEKHFTPNGFFIIAALASAIRWGGMALEPNFVGIVALQSLHGLTFGALHLGCIRYFKNNLPDGTLGAAQLIYGAVMWGIVMFPASIISGYLYAAYSVKAYFAMILLVCIGLIFMLFAKQKKAVSLAT